IGLKPRLYSERGCAKFLSIFFRAAANIAKNPFVVTIATELVVVLVAHKPWIVVVSELNRSAEPGNCLLLFPKQRVNAANPICLIAINDGFRFIAKNHRIDPIPLSAINLNPSLMAIRHIGL